MAEGGDVSVMDVVSEMEEEKEEKRELWASQFTRRVELSARTVKEQHFRHFYRRTTQPHSHKCTDYLSHLQSPSHLSPRLDCHVTKNRYADMNVANAHLEA